MLIICSGPDTYHARQKARTLLAAFRAKHDPTGYSTEVIDADASRAIPLLLERIGSPSLFAQKRMIRCDGFFANAKLADVRMLAKRLEADHEQTVLLSFEQESLSPKHEKEFEKVKLVRYTHPLLFGAKFLAVVLKRAEELGVPSNIATEIARETDGDVWLADSELQKCGANPDAPRAQTNQIEKDIFEAAEAFLTQKSGWRATLESVDEPEAAPSVFLSQSRTCARVADREIQNLHPYAVRKCSALRLSASQCRETLLGAIRAFVASRQGLSDANEADVLF